MKTLYEINWHYKDDEQTVFSHCTVTPITVLREGILPGCSAPSITAKAADGRTFLGSARDYFESEAAAWAEVRQDLRSTVQENDKRIKELMEENHNLFIFLIKIPDEL